MASSAGEWPHQPVLLQQVLEGLDLREGMVVIDATVGAGGHSEGIASQLGEEGVLIGLDVDPEILTHARRRLAGSPPRIELFESSYRHLDSVLQGLGLEACDRILMDLGVSSLQLDRAERGLSFRLEGPLDMRMDPSLRTNAYDLLARSSEQELVRIFREYGEERYARRIAGEVVRARRQGGLPRTTTAFAAFVSRVVPGGGGHQRIHPATRVFQALRIAVNRELEALQEGLEKAANVLRPGGRLAVISFHSLEDRIVKNFIRDRMTRLHRKPLMADEEEKSANPRSRSAKLRVAIQEGMASDPGMAAQEDIQ
jgi:16S rRNA (cytosine1402-N4)-methyltransferase